ncbi:MAG: (2Fe-2S)-binding protein [Clostridiaceae bacterium]|jgi:NAD(P)H-nitrite reductase large subunit|nr:(2Fe-2S)-binding protein [Clostridiaceae bacterium]
MKDIIICRCEEVKLSEIEKAIEDGAETIDGVKRRTRAGMGLCQGKTCERLIAGIISEKTKKSISQIIVSTKRPPVRPVRLSLFKGEEDDE